jgi:DNA-binding MarR family transcriptional regulator
MCALNPVIHQPARLRILALLTTAPPELQHDFTSIRDALDLTDGNTGAHLSALHSHGYLHITKQFANNKPRTSVTLTAAGRTAWANHRAALAAILDLPLTDSRGLPPPDTATPPTDSPSSLDVHLL